MNSEQFTFWLKGFFDNNPSDVLLERQIKSIREKLYSVFNKESIVDPEAFERLIPEKSKPIYSWFSKYDSRFNKLTKEKLMAEFLGAGLEAMYEEGLRNHKEFMEEEKTEKSDAFKNSLNKDNDLTVLLDEFLKEHSKIEELVKVEPEFGKLLDEGFVIVEESDL